MDLQHQGVARISVEGDAEVGRAYIPRARQLLEGLLNRMRLGGLSSGATALRLDDNVFAYARVAGSINAVRIVVGDDIERLAPDRVILGAPDFVSGVVTSGDILQKQDPISKRTFRYLKRFYPTKKSAATHLDLKPDAPQGMERLAIEPAPGYEELRAKPPLTREFSQYNLLRSTMYSGRMKRVVQALMGFGKQLPRESATGQGQNPPVQDGEDIINITRTRSIYARVLAEMMTPEERAREKRRRPTSYERTVAADGLQIRYDYRFPRTHGIHTAPDQTMWLIEIGINRGVLAMPLPLHPLTVRPTDPDERWRFYEALEELELDTGDPSHPTIVRDDDGLYLLDEFGGFPTGESFPIKRGILDAMIRAGEVLELLKPADLQPFYRHSFYSSAMGWAFSESGKEAHNTGYRWEDDGVQRGVHYAVNMNIGARQALDAVPGAAAIARRAIGAASELEDGAELASLLERKALRLSDAQVYELERIDNDAEFAKALNAMTVPPLATGSASLKLQREGMLINPGRTPNWQIKFHEPLLGHLLSHDFLPEIQGRNVRRPCDTAMHVFFADEELKWVRYFFDPYEGPPDKVVESDFEECMYVGNWTETETTGPITISRGFYSGDYDDREVLAGSKRTTKVKSDALGITRVTVSDDLSDIRINYAYRYHTFRKVVDMELQSGQQVYTGIAVPMGSREAYYMAHMKYTERYTRIQTHSYVDLRDPHWAAGWRCVVSTGGFAYWPPDMEECPPGCQAIRGIQVGSNNPRVARFINYEPDTCTDYADKGPWINKCDDLDRKAYSLPLPPLPPTSSEDVPRKAKLTIRLVSAGEPRDKVVFTRDYANANWSLPLWFQPSPDQFGNVQHIAATYSALGEADCAVFDKDLNSLEGSETYGKPAYEDMKGGNTCYIGVI